MEDVWLPNYLQERRIAFMMAWHPRLGENALIRQYLNKDVGKMIVNMLNLCNAFGTPTDDISANNVSVGRFTKPLTKYTTGDRIQPIEIDGLPLYWTVKAKVLSAAKHFVIQILDDRDVQYLRNVLEKIKERKTTTKFSSGLRDNIFTFKTSEDSLIVKCGSTKWQSDYLRCFPKAFTDKTLNVTIRFIAMTSFHDFNATPTLRETSRLTIEVVHICGASSIIREQKRLQNESTEWKYLQVEEEKDGLRHNFDAFLPNNGPTLAQVLTNTFWGNIATRR